MVTNYPQVLVAAQPRSRTGFAHHVRVVLRRMGQAAGGLSGHDLVRHYERNRVALACVSCGHVSPGWTVDGTKPQLRYAGDARRHQITQVRSVSRVA
jgi:hypothetical protein